MDKIRATMKVMTKLVERYSTDTGVRGLAIQLTRALPSKAFSEEIRVLQNFVRDRIRYVMDVHNVETVQTPKATLELGAGDCDDQAVLLGALLQSIGFGTRFVAMGFRDPAAPYLHVMLEAFDPLKRDWIALECIVPGAEPGWIPPRARRVMFAHVH